MQTQAQVDDKARRINLILRQPQLAHTIETRDLTGKEASEILRKAPQLLDRISTTMMTPTDWTSVLALHPQLASKLPLDVVATMDVDSKNFLCNRYPYIVDFLHLVG